MDEKSSSLQKKEDGGDRQTEGSSQKITNFFPVLRPEGRAKMCASKTDDSKQKEMVKKLKGKESMTLRSKRQDKVNEKSNNATNPVKEKTRNVSVASALKTPLGQVLRKSIEASDKKDISSKFSQAKLPEISSKAQNLEIKKNLSDSETGRTLRQKTVVSEKPTRPYRRKSEPNQTVTSVEKVKPEGHGRPGRPRSTNITVDTVAEEGKSESHGRPGRPKSTNMTVDTVSEEGKSESHGRPGRPRSTNIMVDTVSEEGKSDSNSCNKIRKYRKRHFRGGTYGLYLTPARKKKKKMMSSQDESKDDECSVTSTENNSFLDSEDANSLVSEDFLTASERSLVDEEQCLESQISSLPCTEKKTEKLDFNSSVESKDLSSKEHVKEEKPEPKIEISADYEENTQNVTDIFQDLEEMQWESDQKTERADNSNTSHNSKLAQYDDISSESFTNALHFSFKKTSQKSSENIIEKPEPSVDSSNACDGAEKSNEKIDLPEISQTSLNENIPKIFDTKSNSNSSLKNNKNENLKDGSNADIKDNSSINSKQDSDVNLKEELNENSNNKLKSDIDLKGDLTVGLKDDSNAHVKEDSNLAYSNNSESKINLNLLTSNMSEIKDDLNLVPTDIISNKGTLNLLFDDDDDDDKDELNIPASIIENKILSNDDDDVSEKRNFNLSSVVFHESRENSVQMPCDINEKVSIRSPLLVSENDDINNSNSHITSEVKQDSNSIPFVGKSNQDSNSLLFAGGNKQDSNSVPFADGNKQDSNSVLFVDGNKQDSNSVLFAGGNKQDSNSVLFAGGNKQDSNSVPFAGGSKQDSNSVPFAGGNKQDSNSVPFAVGNKQDSNSVPFAGAIKQDSNSVSFAGGNKQDSNSLTFPPRDKLESDSINFNEISKNNDADSITFSDKQDSNFETLDTEEKQNCNYSLGTNEKEIRISPKLFECEDKNEASSHSITGNIPDEIETRIQNKEENDADSITFSDKQDSNFDTLDVEETQKSNHSLSANERESRISPHLLNDEDKSEENTHDVTENNSNEILARNSTKEYLDNHMEVDNPEKDDDDDDDGQSTIANCVKSRQRIKRRFTDDIVDTDLGILSVAAMASVKKAILKPDTPKDIIENFQSVTRTEAKKTGSAAKIECVFNCKQAPIKSCTCEGDSFQVNLDKNEEEAFCQAVDSIDDKLLGCTNPVVTNRLVRPSVKHAFTVMCETHLWRLKHHHACPYCGLFCSQGSFIQCTSADNPRSVHLFHEQCQTKEEGTVPFCFHCGSSSSLKRVNLELQMANPPAFFLNQASKVSVPDVSKARISFSTSTDFSKKEEDEPTLSYKIEESGKILSSAGLPNSSSKEELEKLISMLNDDKVLSYSYSSDELYDMASIGDVLKVLYMLVKGCDPNENFPNHEGETALHAAAANGHATIVHLLIQAGAVCDSLTEKMYTPLMLAVENGHKEVVHYLVKQGAITDFKGENGMASLHLAAKSGNLDILKILMSSRDTDIDAQDDGGWTPIVWASEHDHLNVVKYLLKRGANPNIRDNEGNIGLHWSAFSGSVEISYLYLDYGCDINAVNELGDTPLHIAARQDSFPCVTLFLSRGADVTILNKADKIPAEVCIDKNSDTYLSLSLNMLLKKITKKYQHKAEKIIHRDISRGKEQIAIQCVNAFDDEMPPLDFLYVTENCETMPINIDRTITSLQSCHCEDDCSTASCSCASISYQCWYDKEGLLLPEFNLLDPPMLFECNRACSCWSLNCHNRVLQNGITCRLQLIRTKGKGWGVRTLKDIPRGAFICEYVGELISDSAADKRADDSYLFDLDNRDGETYCLDARYYGNISRFINHLCEPNLVPVKIYVDHQDLNFPRIAFFSSRDIKQYEELGFDYGEKFWAIKYKSFTCECGAPKCKYSKDVIHITMANYYRRLKEEQMEEAAAAAAQQQLQPMEVTLLE